MEPELRVRDCGSGQRMDSLRDSRAPRGAAPVPAHRFWGGGAVVRRVSGPGQEHLPGARVQ